MPTVPAPLSPFAAALELLAGADRPSAHAGLPQRWPARRRAPRWCSCGRLLPCPRAELWQIVASADQATGADPVGTAEVAERLAYSRAAVDQWRARPTGFPAPRWTVGGRPAWEWADVARWALAAGRVRRPVDGADPSPQLAALLELLPCPTPPDGGAR